MAIGQHHLTPLQLRQAQLNRQVLGNAQMYGPAVCQGRHLQRCQIGPSGVAEREAAADQSHETTVASLRSHAAHCFAEAFGYGLITDTQQSTGQLGVLFDRATQCDVFFITLKKSERLFSPTTRYNDYAISPLEFHWESQSNTREASATGQRYIHHVERGSRVLLFVREESKRGGVTLPFLCLGFADYVSHEGERPMAIRWRLHRAIPGGFYPELAVAV